MLLYGGADEFLKVAHDGVRLLGELDGVPSHGDGSEGTSFVSGIRHNGAHAGDLQRMFWISLRWVCFG